MATECAAGVWDCGYDGRATTEACTAYDGEYLDLRGEVWLPVIAGFVMCAMAFTIGANDVANAWGTSVGSKAISLRAATIIAGLSDWLGAVTIGGRVSTTIQQGVSDVEDPGCFACGYCDSQMSVFAVGMFGALIAASVFLALATSTAMPVSTTHAIVGGVVGITVGAVGGGCLSWNVDGGLGGIVLSWVISPLLAGVIGALSYVATDRLILRSPRPRERALTALPALYGLSTFAVVFLVISKNPETKHLPFLLLLLASTAGAALSALVSRFFVVPAVRASMPSRARAAERPAAAGSLYGKVVRLVAGPPEGGEAPRRLLSEEGAAAGDGAADEAEESAGGSGEPSEPAEEGVDHLTAEQRDAVHVFRYLLVFNACLESFAHGANDTANSTAAFAAVYAGYADGIYACEATASFRWIMAIAGFFVLLGIATVGHRVIETVGRGITVVNFQRGWCIEFASTLAVVVATWFGVPVSTTHCQIGAVVFVGLAAFGPAKVSWGMLGKIALSWVLTVPFAGLFAAALMAIFRETIRT